MSASTATNVEQLEKNKIKLTFSVGPEKFLEGLKHAYNRNKNYIAVDGFRKGKAPRRVIERLYGKEVFYDEAINFVLPDAYEEAIDAHGIEPVYKPHVHVESVDEAEGAVFTAEVYVKPEVQVEGYHGLSYPKAETEPTEEDVQNYLQSEREKNARMVTVDRPAEMGDLVALNFDGSIDGVPFEGGKAEDFELTLGSKSFIGTFEDQLVGTSVGDDVDVNVTFPEDYHVEDLAGKPALFKVEILDVQAKEMPELNDEFAQDVSEFETLAEFRQDITETVRKNKEAAATQGKRMHVLQQLVDKAVMDVPEAMYTARIDEMVEDMRYQVGQRGLPLERYLEMLQMTEESLRESYQLAAKEEVEGRLVLEAVSKAEKLEVSDEEYREHVEKMAAQMHRNPEEIMENIHPERKKDFIQDILNQKALDFVVEKAVAVDEIL